MDKPSTVKVTILDKEYRVACPEDSRYELESAARFLDNKMREIKASGRVFGLDRIAVMAALNLAHRSLIQDNQHNADLERIKQMNTRLEATLEQQPAMDTITTATDA